MGPIKRRRFEIRAVHSHKNVVYELPKGSAAARRDYSDASRLGMLQAANTWFPEAAFEMCLRWESYDLEITLGFTWNECRPLSKIKQGNATRLISLSQRDSVSRRQSTRAAQSKKLHCGALAAVVIEPVSGNSLRKTGILRKRPETFRQSTKSGKRELWRPRPSHEKPGFPAHFRVF